MPESSPTKTILRQELLADRQAIVPEVRRQSDRSIGERLIAWLDSHPVAVLGVYWPIRGEPDLRDAYGIIAARGVQLALPVVVEKNTALRFLRWTPGDSMRKDSYGVAIPACEIDMTPQTVLVPCIGFNHMRYRLGYGGGFYDRTLAGIPRPAAIGIAYASALATFSPDAHDIALDAVITESATY
ncbi:5-formyltetrahydrofolate cyclo-ligase [Noviherbaspirillum saxi]|uniref:5-formyltetrahydrofolate cyclo-ligase n=1 Tax=Noviherbaspirillum saxi TaxID=2320863 RepID=A0A3A3FN04_9BURK|nr:5-formyltetrahydrofolate cyclo-ligase [Noviherbaspirillum saxi]RJF97597.1 5-formyltetrahydrofolate cyclo-ligase [Noviherbaspirillum saxi]